MKAFLLDTHTFLWFVSGSPKLSNLAQNLIENDHHDIYFSIASLWEISIKIAIGKLQIRGAYETVIDDLTNNEVRILPLNFSHTVCQTKLPFHHHDPFDRILVSQAIIENLNFISCDPIFDLYLAESPVTRVW
jgi:PIN domain nuclease of toxin-antitoxin system